MQRTKTSTPLKKHIQASPKQEELIHKRRRSRRRFVAILAVVFVALAIGAVLATRIPRIQIRTVAVQGNKVIDTADIQTVVNADLVGHYGYIVPRSNFFLYPKAKMLADLAVAFPRLRNISIYRSSLNALLVTVTEERGTALWCGTQIDPIDLQAPCYFADQDGTIIDTAPLYSGNVYPRFFGGTVPAGASPLGHTFIDPASYRKLLDFDAAVSGLGFSLQAIRLGPGDEDAFVIDLGGGNTALIRFKASDDYAVLLANLKAALGKSELSGQLARDKANLTYFDLRFTNKVYYKFSDDAGDAPATAPVPITTD